MGGETEGKEGEGVMMTRILTDYHHHALAESLLMLFEDRFGWEVYFPYGMDWFHDGVWQFEKEWHGDAVAKQYLEGVWADSDRWMMGDGILRRQDHRHPWRSHRGLTLEQARDMRFDYVISSLPANDTGFAKLAQDTGARFGVQVGNEAQQSRWDLASFILSSSTLPGLTHPSTWGRPTAYLGVPAVIYHQEFDTRIFGPGGSPERDLVASFVNCFPENREPYAMFADLADELRGELRFACYGAYGSIPTDALAAGDISDVRDVAKAMQSARIAWHCKYWSDGFGHVIHDWFSIGRPVVGVPRYYRDKLAGPLWVDGITSIDIETRTRQELVDDLRRLRDDDEAWARMCEAAHQRFGGLVDFGAEAGAIREMLEAI